ncbi:MAG: membrane protein insertion efficiency factor YidD [Candidatus Zixiibacteriota bacterium]|nr:MAG: membrane protein insertion efficiency factor YidD [candidate division Zixibacteria bacterium]
MLGKLSSLIIRLYQLSLGVAFGGRCRFYPSCSEYARQSFYKYGFFTGTIKSAWRLLRCNPWNSGGYDPS